jgi:chemotaxis protein methyltransferase CheR
VLPELIARRRAEGRRQLRFWSAACCSGEEAYTLAMLLSEILPDLADWEVSLVGTDLNERFLRKARAGVYGPWSFRATPAALKARYFRRTLDERFEVVPEIRGRVRFAASNLVTDPMPSPGTMDLVLCRNVLMYFTPRQVDRVIAGMRAALAPDGWLLVSASEASRALFAGWRAVNFPGAIFFRGGEAPVEACATAVSLPGDALAAAPVPEPSAPPAVVAPDVPDVPHRVAPAANDAARESPLPARVRALADAGRLADARAVCRQWLAADKLNAAAHYLSAVIEIEQGQAEAAAQALQRALYLQPDFALAHFLLGSLAHGRGATTEAERHFDNARRMLARAQSDEALPEAEGLTARRLLATLGPARGAPA